MNGELLNGNPPREMNITDQWKTRGIALILFFAFLISSARSATLVWSQDQEGDVTGYKVYFFQGAFAYPPVDVGLATSHPLTNLDSSFVYSIFVTAYNSAGLESVPSVVIQYPPTDDYCNYALSSTGITLDSAPSRGSFEVRSTGECNWAAAATEPWISIESPSERTGPGTVDYSVHKNFDSNPRRGMIIVRDQVFVIMQSGADIAPAIVDHLPSTLDVNEGASMELQVVATGTWLRYQWFKDGMLLPGATNSVLEVVKAKLDDAGDYTVNVFNSAGLLTDGPVSVTVLAARPTIPPEGQPQDILTDLGEVASLSVGALGTDLHFSWYLWIDNRALPVGGDSPFLSFPSVGASDFGIYNVFVTSPAGFTISQFAEILLRDPSELLMATQDSQLQLSATGKPEATYELLVSTDLQTWDSISTFQVQADGTAPVALPNSTQTAPFLFFRTVRR